MHSKLWPTRQAEQSSAHNRDCHNGMTACAMNALRKVSLRSQRVLVSFCCMDARHEFHHFPCSQVDRAQDFVGIVDHKPRTTKNKVDHATTVAMKRNYISHVM